MNWIRHFVYGFAAVALASSVGGQDEFKISDNVNLVLLDVGVKDKTGAYVPNLQKSNFRVLEDGKPRPITQFENVDSPVSVGHIDRSGEGIEQFSEEPVAALEGFFQ